MASLERDPQTPRRFKTARTIFALMMREMSTTYGRSPGGYIWAIVEPLGAITMMTLFMVAGLRIRTPSLGINFPMFYATGMLPFQMYLHSSNAVSRAIGYSRPLLFYPGVTYVDAILSRFLLSVMTRILVSYLVFGGIIVLFETRTALDIEAILLSVSMAAAFGFGVGCLNAYLIPTFPLWDSMWGILTAPLFFMSTIIFTFENLPPLGQDILWYNPLVHVVGMMRRGFYPTYDALYVSPTYVFGVSLICMTAGLVLLGRYYRDILNR